MNFTPQGPVAERTVTCFASVKTYLCSTSEGNLECEEVGHQTLQREIQAIDVHCVDQTQAPLEAQQV